VLVFQAIISQTSGNIRHIQQIENQKKVLLTETSKSKPKKKRPPTHTHKQVNCSENKKFLADSSCFLMARVLFLRVCFSFLYNYSKQIKKKQEKKETKKYDLKNPRFFTNHL
jgi:hypothetical protein